MTGGIGRTLAVTLTDVRARLRRPASAWLLVALALTAYFTVPPPSAPYGLFIIDGAPVRYSSEALACATAILLPLFLGFFGFYVVSRALAHDAASHVGPLVAATPVQRLEYVAGKLLGSGVILGTVTAGFLACVLGMHLVRVDGHPRLDVYAAYYVVFAVPCILGVSAFALLFECVPGLRGRGGDLVWILLWGITGGLAIEPWKGEPTADPGLGRLLDFGGVGFAIAQMIRATGARSFSIGYTPQEIGRPAIDFPGFAFTPATLAWRLESLLLPALVALGAVLLFDRFDPARRRAGTAARRSALALARAIARPVTRGFLVVADRLALAERGPSALRALTTELLLTARLDPLVVMVVIVAVALAVVLPAAILRPLVVPALVALLVPLLAGLPIREAQAGVAPIVRAAPGLGRHLVALKLATAASVALLVTGGPALRLLQQQPRAGFSLLLASLLLAAGSVLLGIATSSAKPFTALALALWYLSLNAGAEVPALDFAGWSAAATPAVQAGYAVAVVAVAALALGLGRLQAAAAD